MLKAPSLGQPAFGGAGARALEVRPPEQVVREERPEVRKRRRGVGERRSRGMKMWVVTWVEVTLRE